ncbi:LacI family DNA-binding transcriptional regulator [Microbacterium aoyamense]|uniref:LacI family DNA-binding transcriptional regulator n=1 Tax=Microbacterium aoyamense TaxID=344166 RepID=A0ABP5AN99_9MICO
MRVPGPQNRRPSMVDVARLAGVAHVTVSRVLNDPESVRLDTRARVEAAIAEVGYRRNDMARALKRGRTNALGLVLAGSGLFELPRVLFGVEECAAESGFSLSMASWRPGGDDSLAALIDRLVGQGVAGIVVIADRGVALSALAALAPGVAVTVVMSGDVGNGNVASVEIDQVHGARAAARHLVGLGHRNIVHITGRLDTFDGRARLDGWRDQMIVSGIAAPEFVEGDFTARSGFEWAARLADRESAPTAIFAGNDQTALGVLAALAARGIDVPRAVSVVGFDDMPGTDFFVPALTTVHQDFVALGRRAVTGLLDLMDGGRARHLLLEPDLVVRASTSSPRRQAFASSVPLR